MPEHGQSVAASVALRRRRQRAGQRLDPLRECCGDSRRTSALGPRRVRETMGSDAQQRELGATLPQIRRRPR